VQHGTSDLAWRENSKLLKLLLIYAEHRAGNAEKPISAA